MHLGASLFESKYNMKYNKLVRDKIPQYIIKKGGQPIYHIADEKEYWRKLKQKLSEEVKEFQKEESMEELADILEVIEAIVKYKKFNKAEISRIKKNKAQERGGFKNRIILEES